MARHTLKLGGIEVTSSLPLRLPCMEPRMVPAQSIVANDYNPNQVAPDEIAALRDSLAEFGVGAGVVAAYDPEVGKYIVIDGFHRFHEMVTFFGAQEIPCVVLDQTLSERMAATVLHNEACGEHDQELSSYLLETLMVEGGWSAAEVSDHLHMEREEVIRLALLTGNEEVVARARKEQESGWK